MARQMKAAKPEEKDIIDILNNSDARAKLQNFIDEAVACKMRMADERESIKTLRETALEKIGIKGKDFNKIVKLYYDNNFVEVQEQLQTLEAILELISGESK